MIHGSEEYIVIVDGVLKYRGTFKECVKWCHDTHWAHDIFRELLITKVVANGKEI